MKQTLTILALLMLSSFAFSQRQKSDSTLTPTPITIGVGADSLKRFIDNVFTHQDSLDVFELIDSLIKLAPEKGPSQLALRLGYNSNIVADNRTFNISQFGLAPGVSYYHKSGAYADVSTYWSQEYKPNFYLTIASLGYIYTTKKFYSVLAEYSHYFYNQPSDSTVSVPYTNNIGITNFFDFKPIVVRLDYYFYFGEKVAHRIMPGFGANFVKRKWLGFDRISIYPYTSVLFGSEQITTDQLYPDVLARYVYNQTHVIKKPLYYEVNSTAFGVMNYSFCVPITFTKNQWTFLLNYTYNIPQALPGEDLSLQNGGYLSFSVTRYISFAQVK